MKSFIHKRPVNMKAAIDALKEEGTKSKISAGGTDLMGTLRDKIHRDYADCVVSLKNISDLAYIREDEKGLKVGAMTRLMTIQEDSLINKMYPMLSQAAHTVASPQLRHMATVGGNICQEPRCWYYRYPGDKFDCMRKGGALCNAMSGNNKYHSIFGSAKVCETPCKQECPNGTNIPEYFDLIRKGDLDAAGKLLLSVNPIAAATGRVCPHTCEDGCNRGQFDESVSVRDVERFMGDYILDNSENLIGPLPAASGKKVAIIGAGPAGLTAAFFLRKGGHEVTILDENAKPGGMLMYGIPAYRLPKETVMKIAAMLENIGVVFRQNTRLGRDVTLEQLQKEYDGVFLGIGAWVSSKANCPGDDAEGVIGGIDFLRKVALKEETGMGKVVAVIGGGNTAMDGCRTAVRMGAKKVYNFYRRTLDEMPADRIEILEGEEEGVEFKYLVAPLEILKDKNGHVKQVRLQKMELGEPDASGRRKPVPIEGAEELVDVDTVIVAIGQGINPDGLNGVTLNRKNEIVTNEESHVTNLNKVFAGGDAAIGPATAIKAIADARKAAAAMNLQLGVKMEEPEEKTSQVLHFDPECMKESGRIKMPIKDAAARTVYDEDVHSVDLLSVKSEANRCFNCGCVAVSPSDIAPALIALDAQIVTTKRTIPAVEFFAARVCSSTVLDEDEIVKEIMIPKPAAENVQFYNKFRYRKSIDFPVLGIAVNFNMKGKVIVDAKLVLSAVNPTPKRLFQVEEFLKGKISTPELAREAAALAVKDALPLAENSYKVKIAEALVRRAVETLA